jgi:hypothetical protein
VRVPAAFCKGNNMQNKNTLTAPRTLRLAVRLARLLGCTPLALLLALYYVPRWVPWPLHQLYVKGLAMRLYPGGYLRLGPAYTASCTPRL